MPPPDSQLFPPMAAASLPLFHARSAPGFSLSSTWWVWPLVSFFPFARVTSLLMMPPTGITGFPLASMLRVASSMVRSEPSPQCSDAHIFEVLRRRFVEWSANVRWRLVRVRTCVPSVALAPLSVS